MIRGRTCAATGLRLLPVDDSVGFHVAKTSYEQPSAPWRSPDVHRQEWGRYDTLGRTYYLAETKECAYAEVLAPFKRANGAEDPLAPIAAALDLTLAETVAAIAEEWDEEDFRGVGALPPAWLSARRMDSVRVIPDGWLVDVQHPDSIAALESAKDGATARFLANQGIPSLTVSVLTSENRIVTTMLAEIMRDAVLDDGSTPRGVHFESKHGGAWCRAIWLPYRQVAPTGLEIRAGAEITYEDPSLQVVASRFRLILPSTERPHS